MSQTSSSLSQSINPGFSMRTAPSTKKSDPGVLWGLQQAYLILKYALPLLVLAGLANSIFNRSSHSKETFGLGSVSQGGKSFRGLDRFPVQNEYTQSLGSSVMRRLDTLPTLTKTGDTFSVNFVENTVNPNIDAKSILLADDTVAMQSIEKTTLHGVNYYNMKVLIFDLEGNPIQTLVAPTADSMSVDSGLLPKPEALSDGSLIVGWVKTGSATVVRYAKNGFGDWELSCQKTISLTSGVIPQGKNLEISEASSGFSVYIGQDDHTYDSVLMNYYHSNCEQSGSSAIIGQEFQGLTHFQTQQLADGGVVVDALFGSTRAVNKINPITGSSQVTEADYSSLAQSSPIQYPMDSLSSLSQSGQSLISTQLNFESQIIDKNEQATGITLLATPLAIGVANAPDSNAMALYYDGSTVFGQLLNTNGMAYGLPFEWTNIEPRPAGVAGTPIRIPVDVLQSQNGTYVVSYTATEVVVSKIAMTEIEVIQSTSPTKRPTYSPSFYPTYAPSLNKTHSDGPEKSGSNSNNSILIIIIVCGSVGSICGLILIGTLVKHLRDNSQKRVGSDKYDPVVARKSLDDNWQNDGPSATSNSKLSPVQLFNQDEEFKPSAPSAPSAPPMTLEMITLSQINPLDRIDFSNVQVSRLAKISPIFKELEIRRIESTTIEGTRVVDTVTRKGEPYECPMTLEKPDNPYVSVFVKNGEIIYIGAAYDKLYIQNWLTKGNGEDPLDREPINGFASALSLLNQVARQHFV